MSKRHVACLAFLGMLLALAPVVGSCQKKKMASEQSSLLVGRERDGLLFTADSLDTKDKPEDGLCGYHVKGRIRNAELERLSPKSVNYLEFMAELGRADFQLYPILTMAQNFIEPRIKRYLESKPLTGSDRASDNGNQQQFTQTRSEIISARVEATTDKLIALSIIAVSCKRTLEGLSNASMGLTDMKMPPLSGGDPVRGEGQSQSGEAQPNGEMSPSAVRPLNCTDALLIGVAKTIGWISDQNLVRSTVAEIEQAVNKQEEVLRTEENSYGQQKMGSDRVERVRRYFTTFAERNAGQKDCPSANDVKCKYSKQLGAPKDYTCPTPPPLQQSPSLPTQ